MTPEQYTDFAKSLRVIGKELYHDSASADCYQRMCDVIDGFLSLDETFDQRMFERIAVCLEKE